MNTLIKLEGVTKKYYVKKKNIINKNDITLTALNNIDLEIYEGEVLGVVGESGCGKSTLGRVILQLTEDYNGRISFDGTEISSMKGEELRRFRRNMQLIFQDPKGALNPRRKVGWLLEESLRVHGISQKSERVSVIKEMMDIVGLPGEYLNRYPGELSGGQAQRISILSALILKPRFIIADEAVSALDVSIQAQILNYFNDLKKHLGLTTVFITHDLSVCYYMSDRIAVMYLGNIVEIGPAEKIYKTPGHPYTKLLLSTLLTFDSDTEDPEVVDAEVDSPINVQNKCPFCNRCSMKSNICAKALPELYDLGEGHYSRCVYAGKGV